MIPKRIEGHTRYLGKPQGWEPTGDECVSLAIRDEHTDGGLPIMTSAWEPTPEELAKIAAGASVLLTVLGVSHPPVMIQVGEPPE